MAKHKVIEYIRGIGTVLLTLALNLCYNNARGIMV